MKKTIITLSTSLLVLIITISFTRPVEESPYQKKYFSSVDDLSLGLTQLHQLIANQGSTKENITAEIHKCREKLKASDVWLRYLEPITYMKINGPLPVEWETEVFEKSEKPYRRTGAGLSLAELYLTNDHFSKDSLIRLISTAEQAMAVFHADSITKQLHTPDHFFLANRLFILNLSSIYTTGFECPDTAQIIPELKIMLTGMKTVYTSFNESFPDKQITPEYLSLYDQLLIYIYKQKTSFSLFNHFEFIRDYVNPLYRLNQHMIRNYQPGSISYNDYTLNDNCLSIFDKTLYRGQNTKGAYSLVTDEKVLTELTEVGKKLFYDPILSGNNKRSCVSCHKPDQFFADTMFATSKQFEAEKRLARNTPSLVNVVFQHLLMLDGRHISLQNQGKDVTTNPIEMGGKEKEIVEKVLSCKEYKKVFAKYLKLTPQYDEVNINHIISAITLFYGSYSFYNSPFDDAMNKKTEIDPDVVHGFNLFMSKAQCGTCHYVPQFNGVKPPFIGSEFEVLGVPNDTAFKTISNDFGRFNVNSAPELKHAFRTNTVRNTQFTKPYMYNGIFRSLEEVINFYNAGGGNGRGLKVENQTLSSDSLKLTPAEKTSLLHFIKSLNEKIPAIVAPLSLPQSSNAQYNGRKIGGEY